MTTPPSATSTTSPPRSRGSRSPPNPAGCPATTAASTGLLGQSTAGAPDHPVVEYVDGLENPSEAFHNIAAWLVRDGLTDEEIIKVLGGNALRALAEIWPA